MLVFLLRRKAHPSTRITEQRAHYLFKQFLKSLFASSPNCLLRFPEKLASRYEKMFGQFEHQASLIHQRTLAQFIEQDTFCEVIGANGGLYIFIRIQSKHTEQQLIEKARDAGVKVYGGASLFIEKYDDAVYLQLGFAGLSRQEIIDDVWLLREAWL